MASGMMNPNVFGMPSVGNRIAPHVAVSPSTAPPPSLNEPEQVMILSSKFPGRALQLRKNLPKAQAETPLTCVQKLAFQSLQVPSACLGAFLEGLHHIKQGSGPLRLSSQPPYQSRRSAGQGSLPTNVQPSACKSGSANVQAEFAAPSNSSIPKSSKYAVRARLSSLHPRCQMAWLTRLNATTGRR
eukprot:5861515-Amphidinium_carterae.2